jgi:Protocatechuate 3,4-dioxygenase beta subunit
MQKGLNPNKNSINIAITVIIFVLLVLGCDDFVAVRGRVVDEDGNPVAGAKVSLYDGKTLIKEEITTKDGQFAINSAVAPTPVSFRDNKIVVDKDGYQVYEKKLDPETIRLKKNEEELNFILKKN